MKNALGIFSRTFPRPDLPAVLSAVRATGLTHVQFNLACAGLVTMPESFEAETARRIGETIRKAGITVSANSGTFNIIDPNPGRRHENFRRLGLLASFCPFLDTRIITFCSGTRDPENMWRAHPDNNTPEAWNEMRASIELALAVTERHKITLAVEPEPANVVSTAAKARRMLDEVKSPRLKILMDGTNILAGQPGREPAAVLKEAFDLLGPDIVLAHGKELPNIPLDWRDYLGHLSSSGFRGALILHGFPEAAVPGIVSRLQRVAAEVQ